MPVLHQREDGARHGQIYQAERNSRGQATTNQRPSQSIAPYIYDPLDESAGEIRVLTLHPGSSTAAIEISIHHESFAADKEPKYEALSYVWGSQENPVLINVITKEGAKTLSVTHNLGVALENLRLENEPRRLWIDAICIDQPNMEELGPQVKRMREIYKEADRVVVWLGPEADDSAHAMQLMKSLAFKVEIDWDTLAWKPSLLGANEPHWANENITLPYDEREWRSLYDLLHRQWFERLWVRQEIAFSKSNAVVLCGTETLLWQDFRKANHILTFKPLPSDLLSEFEADSLTARTRHIDNMANYKSSRPSWVTLRQAGSSKCSDPRDKVYANLGFIQDAEGDIGLQPDYSLSVSDVNNQLVSALLKFQKRLSILRCCELSTDCEDMPSWTPNWTISTETFTNVGSDCFAPADAVYLGNGVLRVEGIMGGVVATAEMFKESYFTDVMCAEIYKIAPQIVLDDSLLAGGASLDVYCRAIVGGDFREARPDREDYPTWQCSRDTISEILRMKGEFKATYDTSFLIRTNHFGSGRCFFTTEDGKMGWAPKSAKAGDVVCVILGCEAPLVLREIREACYQVVGECYMDGVMEGELVLGVLPESYRTETYLERSNGAWYDRWIDTVTEDISYDDPRLVKIVKEGESGDYVHIGTSFHSPFLTSERLKEAGVQVRSFDLV